MAEILHEHNLDLGQPHASLGWTVTRQPGGVTDPMVVNFRKVGTQRTLLNQNARWTPLGAGGMSRHNTKLLKHQK